MSCLWDEWQWVSLSQTAPPGIPGDLPGVTLALPSMGFLLGGPYFPNTRGTVMDTKVEFKDMESSSAGDSDKGPCTEAPQIGATGWDPAEQRVGETPLIWGGNAHFPAVLVQRT